MEGVQQDRDFIMAGMFKAEFNRKAEAQLMLKADRIQRIKRSR